MDEIEFRILKPSDHGIISQISSWYLEEWNIPIEKTHSKLELVTNDSSQFQVIMFVDKNPVSTGGIYHHVGLLDVKPQFKIYKHWLGLVYTDPNYRRRGLGALLCEHIESLAKDRGIMNLYLFSDTAVGLYNRLGWEELDMVGYGNRMVTVMGKLLG